MSADPNPTSPVVSTSTSGSAARRHPRGTVYLFHFDQRYEHAGHYTGWAEDLDHRVAEHLAGRGARLIEVITQAGISFRLARTWPGVTSWPSASPSSATSSTATWEDPAASSPRPGTWPAG